MQHITNPRFAADKPSEGAPAMESHAGRAVGMSDEQQGTGKGLMQGVFAA